MECCARPASGKNHLLALCFARNDRRRRSRCLRQLVGNPRVWRRLDPARGRCRLGALPQRAMGVGRTVGLELGWPGAMGLCALPLRSLGAPPRRLGLGTGHADCTARLCAGDGGLDRNTGRQPVTQYRIEALGRLVSARAARGLCPRLPQQRELRAQHQRHPRHKHRQRRAHRQQSARGDAAHALRPSRHAARGDGRTGRCCHPPSPSRR